MPQCLSIRTTRRVFIAVLDVFLFDMAILTVHPVFFFFHMIIIVFMRC